MEKLTSHFKQIEHSVVGFLKKKSYKIQICVFSKIITKRDYLTTVHFFLTSFFLSLSFFFFIH